jgi:hypothetical protein
MWVTALLAHTKVSSTPLTPKTSAEWDSARTLLTMSLAQKTLTALRSELKEMARYLSPEHVALLGENQTKSINGLQKPAALKYLADARIRKDMEDEKNQIEEYNTKANEIAQRREVMTELLEPAVAPSKGLRREPSNPEAPTTLASPSLKAAAATSHIVANHVFRILAIEKGLLLGGDPCNCADIGLDVIQITQKKMTRQHVSPSSQIRRRQQRSNCSTMARLKRVLVTGLPSEDSISTSEIFKLTTSRIIFS